PLRSDHDACLWGVNRTGEALMVVDPFRELGDSGSSMDNSGRNSMNDSDEGPHSAVLALPEVTKPSTTAMDSTTALPHPVAAATTTASQSLPELGSTIEKASTVSATTTSGHSKTESTVSPQQGMSKSASASVVNGSPTKPSTSTNGHAKSKSSSRNAFIALFSPSPKQSSNKKLLSKRSKHLLDMQQESRPVERLESNGSASASAEQGSPRRKSELTRENSTVSLAVTASEISAYSRRSQLELQAELSPWQSFLLPTELIIYQAPVLKRKGLFSRSCILVLTDFPRLLYFDDSNHYFSQLFNSNTNEAFSCWYQQQRVAQWEQLEQQQQQLSLHQQLSGLQSEQPQQPRLYQHPSLSQESQNHQHQQLNALHQPLHGRRGTNSSNLSHGKETTAPVSTASGFVLTREGSNKTHHQYSRSEHIPGQTIPEHEEDTITTAARPVRTSLEHPPHQHSHPHTTHHRQQSNGHNRIDVEKHGVSPSSSPQTNVVATASPTTAAIGSVVNGSGGSINGTIISNSNSTDGKKMQPPVSPGLIKASKRQAKLRGEILFTASVVSEVKGKKCFFIHTTKKSYYFEEYREGDAKLWVRVLERCMEEWFGERGSGSGGAKNGASLDKVRRYSKPLLID
ncbi:hypothetical protein BX616_005484, partial [Lobosporangium transversale]